MVQLHFFFRAWLVGLCFLATACAPKHPQVFDSPANQAASVEPAPYPYPVPDAQWGRPSPDADSTQPESSGKTIKVGLLVPLSGTASELGTALRDAAVLALFDKYATLRGPQSGVKVELVTKDTKGTPEGAKQAAAAAVKEGARLLLGPLFARSVEAVKPLAKTGKVTLLSFSNNKSVAGDGVFIMGFDPAEQAQRVARYTFRQDIQNVAALIPNDAYGRQVQKAFTDTAKLLGRQMKPVVRFTGTGSTLQRDINTLVKEGTVGARFMFSALFLPVDGNQLGPILSGLGSLNVTPQTIQFIGTGLWDDHELIRLHNLNGAWLASSPPDIYDAFEQRFRNSYEYKPPRLASLAYDAVALATTMATSHHQFQREALTSPNGFSGPANGIFRFRANGHIERGLAVLRVNGRQGFSVIDPAPTRFTE